MPGTSTSLLRSTVKQREEPAGFPCALLPLLRCSRDAGAMILAAELETGHAGIIQGTMKCTTCAAEYSIEDGIVRAMHEANNASLDGVFGGTGCALHRSVNNASRTGFQVGSRHHGARTTSG